ncbi:MAG: hypothetical protein CMH39_06690 [Micrococcales bacterium]|nr:hypothetical protein [Micrococcales bacterium]|tara:strand:- start:49 stop:345 length:297 start_codon:yes stop_codon:yes gene_type:complete
MTILNNPIQLTQEQQAKIELLKSETLKQKTNRLFATHIQKEFESFVTYRWDMLVEGFEQEFGLGFTDQRKEELADQLDVKVSVDGVASGYIEVFPYLD